ncbi:unnamed protein product [Sphenostylis stenocarpa]|uniref:Uncharacterized protein n=1 Tax=Sphenostylis stenocarpa TaxID=92480 RepID=A0AA86W4V6_9FABA|nr:unnamed protein product [Sphenostylis stenocarpa]
MRACILLQSLNRMRTDIWTLSDIWTSLISSSYGHQCYLKNTQHHYLGDLNNKGNMDDYVGGYGVDYMEQKK